MKVFFLCFLMLCAVKASSFLSVLINTATTVIHKFGNFSQQYQKQYSSTNELKFREEVFSKNVKDIDNLNKNPNNTYPQGITYYSDFTPDEFKALILNKNLLHTPELLMSYPDWNQTNHNGTTPVTIQQKIKKSQSSKTKNQQNTQALNNTKQIQNKNTLTVKSSQFFSLPFSSKYNLSLNKSVNKPTTNLNTTKNNNNKVQINSQANFKINTQSQSQLNNKNTSTPIVSIIANSSISASGLNNISVEKQLNIALNTDIFQFFQSKQAKPLKEQKWKAPPGAQKSIDWRDGARVSHVKMQGACGNCYSFSTTGALQSAFMIKNNQTNVSFSDQQITDCCGIGGFGCNGCEGGWQWQALRYILKQGIATEEEYKTISSQTGQIGKCSKVLSPKRILDEKTPFIAIQPGNLTLLYQAVSKQPVSVGVDSSNMQFVMSEDSTAIFTNCSSKPQDANHAMLVVGYDTQGNWILKNSWSQYWGDKGYIKIKAGNTCGVANFALYPNVISNIKVK